MVFKKYFSKFLEDLHRETRENREQKKGVSPVAPKRFEEESKKRFPLPSRVGAESREGKRSPCSCRSRCSRFIEFKGSVPCSSETVPGEKGAKRKCSVSCKSNRESLYGLFLSVRAVRVVRGSWNLKRSVRCNSLKFNREMRENREQKGSVPCSPEAVWGRDQGEGFPSPPGWEPRAVKEEEALVRAVRVVRGS